MVFRSLWSDLPVLHGRLLRLCAVHALDDLAEGQEFTIVDARSALWAVAV